MYAFSVECMHFSLFLDTVGYIHVCWHKSKRKTYVYICTVPYKSKAYFFDRLRDRKFSPMLLI